MIRFDTNLFVEVAAAAARRRAGLGQATSSPYVLRQTGSAYQHARYEQVCVSGWTTDPIPPAAPTLPCPRSGEPGVGQHTILSSATHRTRQVDILNFIGGDKPHCLGNLTFKINFAIDVSKKRHHTYLFGFIKRLKKYNYSTLVK